MTASETPRLGVIAPVVLVVFAVVLGGCSTHSGSTSPSPAVSSTATGALPAVDCSTSLRTGPLPLWARGGFTDDGSAFRHVEGLRGGVVGVVFGYPLSSPPRPSRANKILWVAREPTSARLTIDAQLDGAGPVVSREVGFGGGQSVIDLPTPGCWRMTLRWDERLTDTVDLPYEPAP